MDKVTTTKEQSPYVRNIALDLIFTVLTCGIYNIYVNYKQMQTVNAMLGAQKYDFWPWLLFCLLTCGLYHIYHEYRMTTDLLQVLGRKDQSEAILCVVLLVCGLTPVVDAIQQYMINRHYGADFL
jgi:hypothetical protein